MGSTASKWGAAGASIVTGLFALVLAPQPARACGGLFCDRPPPNPFDPLPVAQTGENVVFAVSGTGAASTVEAHIQVYYSGPAAQFSWVVPVDTLPTVSVGTDQLFTAVANRTQPRYYAQYLQQGTCKPQGGGVYDGGAFTTGAGGATGTGAGGAGGAGGVNVAFQGAVGPYGVAVIQSGSADALLTWLGDNGYFVGDAAKTIIAQYVSEQKYFVAVKLLSGVGVNAIQPIVLKFAGAVPCVPLRLTAIAAISDLSVNLWVLGDNRAVPKNYFEIKLNDARLDWLNYGSNYSALVKEAANEAGGNAFIAEYAGTARIMDSALWPNGRINLAALQSATTPPQFVAQVASQGLTQYGPMLSILEADIPEPQVLKDMGISEATFYNGIAYYYSQYASAFAPFDAAKAAADVDKAIVMPLMNAQALFDAHPYLTRLATFISPEEMTRDPLFIFNPDLPELPNNHQAIANVMCGNQAYLFCEAPIRLDLPDGEQIWLQRPPAMNGYCSGTYDRTDLDQMPALAIAYQQAEAGGGQRVADNTPLIASALAAHNKSLASVSARVSPAPVAGGGGLMSGCGCRVGGGGASAGGAAGLGALAAALAAWRGRRRRRRRR